LSQDSPTLRPAPNGVLALIARLVHIAAEGVAISLVVLVVGLVLLAIGLTVIGSLIVVFAFAVALFFRDPERYPPASEGVIISGADGKITDIADAPIPGSGGRSYKRVSVFMSPLNVHVNRAPIGGEVIGVEHTPGDFRAAFSDAASEHNERNKILMRDSAGRTHAMVQVAGYLARRIVCRLRSRDKIQSGQRIGLIMFGSRVDHFVPPEYSVTVVLGQRVRSGKTIIGELLQ
jgi:phosphatidylserine decarboxylase